MSNVLVLNNSFFPLYITSKKKAVKLIFREKADIVSIQSGEWILYDFSEYLSLNVDFNIIRLNSYSGQGLKVNLTRKNIYLRDDFTCQYCGQIKDPKELNLDHIIPKSKGGTNTWENLVCSCIKCNSKKSNKSLKESGYSLIKKPKKPDSLVIFKQFILNDDWKNFFPSNFKFKEK